MMGGHIGFESEEGKGSTFWFTVKLEKQLSHGEKQKPLDISGKRVLVVDDNRTNRMIVLGYLKMYGCDGDEAENGFIAMEKLYRAKEEGKPFHVAVIDMEMPEIDGGTLGRKIKEDPLLKDTVMILLSSICHYGDMILMKDIGFASYLTKPVKSQDVYNSIAVATGMKEEFLTEPVKKIKGKYRILLAEDNIKNQEILRKILEKEGYSVLCAANGKEVLDSLKKIPCDLILMDIMMPEMDGITATEEIRKTEKNSNRTYSCYCIDCLF